MKKVTEFYTLLLRSNQNDSTSIISIINKFQPLLKKYAFLLQYEDAYYDLLLKFLEIIKSKRLLQLNHTADAFIVSYIQKSIYHSYILLSQNQKRSLNVIPVSFFDDENNHNKILDKLLITYDKYFEIELRF